MNVYEQRLRSVLDVVQRYLPPNGLSKHDALTEIIGLVDPWPVEQRAEHLVPGQMRCAKCNFQLQRITLAVNLGVAVAGDNKTEPCPNGCGPLWPVTWEQEARACWKAMEAMHDQKIAAERIADDAMFELLLSEGVLSDGIDSTCIGLADEASTEVFELAKACQAIRDAFEWLAPRGYVALERDGLGEYLQVLKRPGEE